MRYEIFNFPKNKWGIKDMKTGKRLRLNEIWFLLNDYEKKKQRLSELEKNLSFEDEVNKFMQDLTNLPQSFDLQ